MKQFRPGSVYIRMLNFNKIDTDTQEIQIFTEMSRQFYTASDLS